MEPYWRGHLGLALLTAENYLPQGFARWLIRRSRVPTSSNKPLSFPWHGLKIILYLLLTINCPYSTQLSLTFQLSESHHMCLSKGVAKNKSSTLIMVRQYTRESFVLGHTWWVIRTWCKGHLIQAGKVMNREVKWLASHVESVKTQHENQSETSHLTKE